MAVDGPMKTAAPADPAGAQRRLLVANAPATFWKTALEPRPTAEEWRQAALGASEVLPAAVRDGVAGVDDLLCRVLAEAQFGPGHFDLGTSKRAYYHLKRGIPRPVTRALRRAHRLVREQSTGLRWPIEDRYVAFLRGTLARLLDARGVDSTPFIHFWPHGARWALILTHDVETASGQARIPVLADIEERLGFRSCFNVVPERYPIDRHLVAELRSRGFEVAVHDLNHDGKLFNSREQFLSRAHRINGHVRELDARGFRAALMHRHPEWMQALDLDYDLSFFDTDPYEPIPGGTMSIWPFHFGRFVELPYTLVQDYTLTSVLDERTPRLWVEKVRFVADNLGMALLNTHPDYLRLRDTARVYGEFLEAMRAKGGYWNTLPRDAAFWWRARTIAPAVDRLPGSTLARAHLDRSGLGGVAISVAEVPATVTGGTRPDETHLRDRGVPGTES